MTIDRYRELAKIVCEELNVKIFDRLITNTKKGELHLLFDSKTDILNLKLGDNYVGNSKVIEKIINALDNF